MEETNKLMILRIESGDVWAFEGVAPATAKREIIGFGCSTVLAGDDVV
jgi:hypothetical protein